VATAERAAEMDAPLHERDPVAAAKPAPTLAQEVAYEPEAVREVLARLQLRVIPTRRVSVNAVHEGVVVAHLRRHPTQQVTDLLLLLHIHVEVAHHDDAAFGPDVLLGATELARSHVA